MMTIAAVLLATTVYAAPIIMQMINTKNKITEDLNRDKSPLRSDLVSVKREDPVSILLLGVDKEDGVSRSDTMILVTINPKSQDMKMLSIPRDMRVKIPEREGYHKINAAFAFGEADLAVRTVEQEFNVPIDYYAEVNFDAFVGIVDALGGVSVDNKFAFSQSGHSFSEGHNMLNGKQALAYVRMRKHDLRGDYGRQERQQEVIQQLIPKAVSFQSLKNINEILDSIGDNVKMNFSTMEMWSLKQDYAEAAKNVESIQVEPNSRRIHGIVYELVLYEEKLEISKVLRSHLELSGEPNIENDDYGVQFY